MACDDKKQTSDNDWPVGKKNNPQNKQRQIAGPSMMKNLSFQPDPEMIPWLI